MSAKAKYTTTLLDIPEGLIDQIKENGSYRDVISDAVGDHLDGIVKLLLDAGVVGPDEKPKARPRKVNIEVWNKLSEAEKATGIRKKQLLLACLQCKFKPIVGE